MRERITQRQVSDWRARLLEAQKGNCALCGLPIKANPVLDHCHTNGHLRGVLHTQCNGLLGKIENYRYGIVSMPHFLAGAWRYMESTRHLSTPLHYTFRTPDEKKEQAKKRAAKRRAVLKERG